ncbi:CrcB-like protein-domain-containing protein [Dendryphion nanum]|uniref:CrcB-like protein-domain-containing protein n=1 Tax=Dendryphion nanum TaxID=256645 RepID=A0A9P9IAJ4_9PLEO|nr:CrcB-like protein-domain-containing protein [Dendryphion nanum]
MADSDDGSVSQRESHYNHQRSSLRSDKSVRIRTPPSRPQSAPRIHDFVLREHDNVDRFELPQNSPSPAPVIPRRKGSLDNGKRKNNLARRGSSRAYGSRTGTASSRGTNNIDEYLAPATFYRHSTLEEERTESPASRRPQPSHSHRSSPRRSPLTRRGTPATELSITALPVIPDLSSGGGRASRFATGLYTISYLIFFSILGTLARLGLQWLTFYPGAPVVFSELWANVAGTFIIGFLGEDQKLFSQEWGQGPSSSAAAAAAVHSKVKKTIPLYIGLVTGFCGSFTSFSSFMRDLFFALSNNLPSPNLSPPTSTLPRHNGYSVMAVLAVLFTTLSLCYSAVLLGSHLAIYASRITPTLPFTLTRRLLDPLFVFLGLGSWIAAVIMCIFPPDRLGGPVPKSPETWRGQALFACAFAPAGCLIRYYLSAFLNPLIHSFPLGTFTANIFGTAVLGMAFDLQHVRIAGSEIPGGGLVSCQVLQGVMDGFCGALTTVSTWIAEIRGLSRGRAYVYAVASMGVGLGVLVCVMGSVRWGVGWEEVGCVT